jgi:3-hydroxypropionyl-CoA synthetase (ADP-forming)
MTRASWENSTEAILRKAFDEGRSMLYEHEMYHILSLLDFRVPVHCTARGADEITAETLRRFGSDRIVLKVISPAIMHKSVSGGVAVALKDLDFVRYTVTSMLDRFARQGTPVHGVLLAEYIEYSQSLGNEILLGFRESDTFGTVISFSKGGDDADHFAHNFSAPNLIFPPIDRTWATALQQSTKIYSRYVEEHRTGFISHIVDAEIKFSRLATRFSSFFDSPSAFALTAFEVNPFVFTPDNRFIALDGWASFSPKLRRPAPRPKSKKPLDAFFKPNGIAVVGVSASNAAKPANIILENLILSGHTAVFAINSHGGSASAGGRRIDLFPNFAAVGQRIDLAVVCVPAKATLEVVRQCAAAGVKAIVLIPGGFSETTHDSSLEEQIHIVAHAAAMRIIGPNCLGLIFKGDRSHHPINTFFLSQRKFRVPEHRRSNVALVSQSGAFCVCEVYHLRHAVAPAYIVSYGNQLDVDAVDIIEYLNNINGIDVIGLYSEGLQPGSGRAFFNAVALSGKTVIAYKAGRTAEGHRAIQSHTACVAGEYEVARAALKQAGAIVASTLEEHIDFIKTFALLCTAKVRGTRVGIVANAGFEKTCAADNLGTLVPAQLSDATIEALRRGVPPFVSVDPFLDLTPMVADDRFADAIDILLAADEIDALCVSIVPHAEFIHTTDEELDADDANLAVRITEIACRRRKPVVVSVNVLPGADSVFNRFCAVLESGGVPTFPSAGRAMSSLNEFIHHKMIRKKRLLSEWLK